LAGDMPPQASVGQRINDFADLGMKAQSLSEGSSGVIVAYSSVTHDHFSMLNSQLSGFLRTQSNLICLHPVLKFKDSRQPIVI